MLGELCPKVVCLQETKLRPNSQCSFKGYTVLRRDMPADPVAHGGVLLAVHRSIPSRHLELRTGLQAVAARVSLIAAA